MIKNPVLTGFFPDPSILFHDGVFYIANSTFEYFPGVCVSASRDLANWDTVAYPLAERRLLDMRGNPASAGVWAPCLTYSGGLFYLAYTDMKHWSHAAFKDSPNYITTAPDIRGPWSDPVYVNSSGFDPSIFHDDDGRKYFLNMEWDYRLKGDAQFAGILLTELDAETLAPISEAVNIYRGTDRGQVEAPHLYKVGDYYYLLTAEGGTIYNHAETVARSKDIRGPYETHPGKHLVDASGAPDSPLQKTGHGSICQGPDGRWWFAFLMGRPLPQTKACPLGRETGIAEIVWEDGWPRLKNGTTVPDEYFEGYGEPEEPSLAPGCEPDQGPGRGPDQKTGHELDQKTGQELGQVASGAIDYDFASERFGLDFMCPRTEARYELADGALRLYGGDSPLSCFGQSMLVRRQCDFSFEFETALSLPFSHYGRMAGLLYRYDEDTQYFLRVACDERTGQQTLGILCFDKGEFSMPMAEAEIPVNGIARLRLKMDGRYGFFSYSFDGDADAAGGGSGEYRDIPYQLDAAKLSDEYASPLGFTGAFVGMCAVDLVDKKGYADFLYAKYRAL